MGGPRGISGNNENMHEGGAFREIMKIWAFREIMEIVWGEMMMKLGLDVDVAF